MRLALAAVAALGLALPAAAQERATFAVLPFRNEQSFGLDAEAYGALEVGIAQLVASEIGRSAGGRVADRGRTGEAGGPRTGRRHDAATAQQIGGLVGARYVVTGNFVDAYGRLRLNARVVDAQTGRFVAAVTNADPRAHDRAQLHAAIRDVTRRLLEGLKLAPPPAEGAALPFDAILAFSRGLVAEERGERAAAAEAYGKAVSLASGFAEAQEGLQRVR